MTRNSAPRVESVHRALVLLKALIGEPSVGVTEAAAALGVNASTAQRLLATLVADGFAVQGPDRRYAVGPALRNPSLATPIPSLIDRMRPALEALFERTGETVHLATLVGTRINHLDGIEATNHYLKFGSRVGVLLPAHLTSGGKALLADLTDEEIRARYAMANSATADPYPDLDVPALLEQLEDVRETRIAWNFGQSEPGVAALSIAVSEPDGTPAALSIALPTARYTKAHGERWADDLRDIADMIAAGTVA
ncbi:IclR family transcriptional regulator [Microbacterium gorillae]|uniref:IclR family transcriptional regulator n=1 Tax=Microbacterium gorillae TaxID=1231063 RepID=UPI0006945765|nr:IclR family transcriptional regulator [Microbacterium gorillae]